MNNDNQPFVGPNPQPTPQPTPAPQPPTPEPTPAPQPLTPEPTPAPQPTPQPAPTPQPFIPDSDPMPNIPVQPPKPPKTPLSKNTIILIVIAAVLVVGAVVLAIVLPNITAPKKSSSNGGGNSSSSQSADTDFDKSYDLSELTENLEIKDSGTYELKGETDEHSVIVNASGEVTLYLNNATIRSGQMAAIANISGNPLTIKLADDSSNTLIDGGASDYRGCLYSTGAVTVEGNSGSLSVNGSQASGAGITVKSNSLTLNGGMVLAFGTTTGNAGIIADNGYIINGGMLAAFGSSETLQAPSSDSKQNSLAVAFDKSYDAKSKLSILDSDAEAIFNITTASTFRNFVFSSSGIRYGTYSVKVNDETVIDLLTVINTVTTYGITAPEETPADNSSDNQNDQNSDQNSDNENNQSDSGEQLLSNGTDTYGRIPISELPTENTN